MSAPTSRDVRANVRGARRVLLAATAIRALGLGVAVALAIVAAVALVDLVVELALPARRAARVGALLAGLAVLAHALWRGRHAASPAAVALWLEERHPELLYALVTAWELPAERGAELDRLASRVDWRATVVGRAMRAMRLPAVALAVASVALLLLPAGSRARAASPRAGDRVDRPALARPVDPLASIAVAVEPPRYTGRPVTRVDDPTTVTALAGSIVTVEGRGELPAAPTLSTGGAVALRNGDSRWAARLVAPARAALLHLRAGARERLLAIDARPDAIPTVRLVQPARDTVLRAPTGRIPLAAEASDDIGLAQSHFELIVSSGEGESFTFKTHVLGAVRGGGVRRAFASALSLDSLALKPGDILHLRAVARDANDVTGPGIGSSETRTLRVARANEYDSVAVEPAPPPAEEKSALSQRMLIMLTEALETKRPRLTRQVLTAEARRISQDQAKLRKSVGEIIFMRLSASGDEGEHAHGEGETHDEEAELLERARAAGEHDAQSLDFEGGESPVVAINRPLLEAYNAMWDAGRELDQIDLRRALPHMRRALAAIQRARQAERIYLRGRPPAAVVDLAKVRLTGKDKGDPGARAPLAALDTAAAARARRLARAVALAATPEGASAAVDSLLVLRVDVVGDAPALAAALDALADAIRRGRTAEATTAALRTRRAAAGEPQRRDSLALWSSLP